jgi:hypothetical protein
MTSRDVHVHFDFPQQVEQNPVNPKRPLPNIYIALLEAGAI